MEALILPGNLDALAPVRRYVQQAAQAADLDAKTAYGLVLAIDELVTNVVTHGYAEAGLHGDVAVQAHVDTQTLTITVEDCGVPFDPLQKTTPDHLERPLEERPIGGLGIYLVLENVDEFRYEYVDQRNRNIVVMHRPVHA